MFTPHEARKTLAQAGRACLLFEVLQTSVWRLTNLSLHASLVVRVTVGCGNLTARAAIVQLSALQLLGVGGTLVLRDARPASLVLVAGQAIEYFLYRSLNPFATLAVLLLCLANAEHRERRDFLGGLSGETLLLWADARLRGVCTRAALGIPLAVFAAMSLVRWLRLATHQSGIERELSRENSIASLGAVSFFLLMCLNDEGFPSYGAAARAFGQGRRAVCGTFFSFLPGARPGHVVRGKIL